MRPDHPVNGAGRRAAPARTLAVAGALVLAALGGARLYTAGAGRPAADRWPLGRRLSYDLRYDTSVATVTAPDAPFLAWTIDGRLELVPVRRSPHLSIHARLVGGRVRVSGAGAGVSDNGDGTWRERLGDAFGFDLDERGALVSVREPAGTPQVLANARRALVASLQIVDDDGRRRHWTAEEEDATGRYEASYARRGAGLTKTKVRYVETRAAHLTYSIAASEAELTLDGTGAIAGLELSERLRAEGEAPMPSFLSKTTLHLRATDGADGPADVELLSRALEALPAATASAPIATGSDPSLDEARAEGRSFDEVMAVVAQSTLRGPDASNADQTRAGRAYVALTALLRLHPENIGKLVDAIGSDLPFAAAAVAALRDAGTPETQAALQELLKDPRLVREIRFEAARALSRVDRPTESTVQTLESLRTDDELGTQARYGLGSTAFRLRNQQPELADRVISDLTQELAATDSASRRTTLLTALGNAGASEAMAEIQPFLGDASAEVRAAAVQALRRIPGATADELLAAATHDASSTVRTSTVDAISERAPSDVLVNAISNAVLREPQDRTRALAVGVAADWLPTYAQLRPVLEVVASNDSHGDIRQRARNALERKSHDL
jgi:Lipoprotein amino terminal region